nr:MAG TPA: hypothetical protein [Caudoviricetes sp.]
MRTIFMVQRVHIMAVVGGVRNIKKGGKQWE